jgi:hypothetical protein
MSSGDNPLNLELYKRLQRNFGKVLIANPGEGFVSTVHRGLDGRPKQQVAHSGEYYRVCCPYCKDTRSRLWVNHKFGAFDENTRSKNTHLAICYNENCLSHPARRQRFENAIFRGMNWSQRKAVVVQRGSTQDDGLRAVSPPGTLVPVNQLADDHKVSEYLRSRGYDPVELGEHFHVAYCEFAEPRYPAAADRIVASVVMDGQLVGWQCRYIGDIDWKQAGFAKYYTRPGMPKRLMFYNYDACKEYPLVVLTEGISDVWSVGPQAIAMLGKKLHMSQERLLCDTWGHGLLVILLDPDARDETDKLVQRLEHKFARGVVPIYLEGQDPGDLDRDTIWAIISAELESRGYEMYAVNTSEKDAT